jgi:hypothetical protein
MEIRHVPPPPLFFAAATHPPPGLRRIGGLEA